MLELIKTAQFNNGLRHNNYEQYRKYCARRLHTIRHASAVNFTYGKKFTQRELTPDDVTDPRHLQIALFSAERAWAEAMRLNEDTGDASTAATRNHRLNRLRRAAEWADTLHRLATARGDPRTALEAEAYAAWMKGTLHQSLEQWAPAATALETSRKIYEGLAGASVGSKFQRARDFFQSRIQEIEPAERFCKYQRDRESGKSAAAIAADAASGTDAIRSKVDAALASAGAGAGSGASGSGSSKRGAGASNSVFWRKTDIPVRSDKLRAALKAAEAAGQHLGALLASAGGADDAASASGLDRAYLAVLSRYDEVARLASSEAGLARKGGQVSAAQFAGGVDEYAQYVKLRHMADHGTRMAAREAAALARFQQQHEQGAGTSSGEGATQGGKTKGKKSGKATPASASASAPSVGPSSSAASAPAVTTPAAPVKAAVTNPFASPLDAAAPTNDAAAKAATRVAAHYGLAVKTVEEMLPLCGGNTGKGPASAGAGSVDDTSLPGDAQMIAALNARRAYLTAARCWYVALAALHKGRTTDASSLLTRCVERASAALEAYKAVAASSSSSTLPAAAIPVGSDDEAAAATDSPLALSGVSQADVAHLTSIHSDASAQLIAMQARHLLSLSGLASNGRDGWPAMEGAYQTLLTSLARLEARQAQASAAVDADDDESASPSPSAPGGTGTAAVPSGGKARAPLLPVSIKPTGGAGAGGTARASVLLERTDAATGGVVGPTADALHIAAWPLAPVPIPFRPAVLDLAFYHFTYPDVATLPKPASAPAAAAAPRAGPSSAAAPKATAASPAAMSTPAEDKGSKGGLLGWLRS